MTPQARTPDWVATEAAIQELRRLADDLRRAGDAVVAAGWDDGSALARVVVDARAEQTTRAGTDGDIAAATPPQTQPGAHAGAAVELARAAVADAIVAVAAARGVAAVEGEPPPVRRAVLPQITRPIPDLVRRVVAEVRHIGADKPRAILLRLVITLAISLSLVTFYHFSGWSQYDDVARLSLYLFSGVVGSVVCTNALCFEAQRVRAALSNGDLLWRILVAKNLAMAFLITVAGLPVIGFLVVTDHGNPAAMVDQLVTMVFIWLGVANVLSVSYPLRHEPVPARLRDGTWKPYLFSFALSYGVGLTVNLMIYWRLWSRQAASAELAGGDWAAFALVLASAVLSWMLLTVFAVACSREPRIRRLLSREMITYRRDAGVQLPDS